MDDETQSYTTPHYSRSSGVIGHRQFGLSSVGDMQIVCGVYAKDAVVDALAVFWGLPHRHAVGFGGYACTRDSAHRASRNGQRRPRNMVRGCGRPARIAPVERRTMVASR
jgi:hypothetical protein